MRNLSIVLGLALILALASGCLSGSEERTRDYSAPQTNSEAGIAITITYLPEIADFTAFAIEVTAHSDYDDLFETNSYLRDSRGTTYQPLSYDGSRGHHASGILRFPRVESEGFELVIQGVGGVKERVYTW